MIPNGSHHGSCLFAGLGAPLRTPLQRAKLPNMRGLVMVSPRLLSPGLALAWVQVCISGPRASGGCSGSGQRAGQRAGDEPPGTPRRPSCWRAARRCTWHLLQCTPADLLALPHPRTTYLTFPATFYPPQPLTLPHSLTPSPLTYSRSGESEYTVISQPRNSVRHPLLHQLRPPLS